MNNNIQTERKNPDFISEEYNSLSAVEQVYPADIIDSAECANNLSALSQQAPFDHNQEAANDAIAYADIYSLKGTRLAKHNRSFERRSSKSQLTDRRATQRLNANGDIQQDRRAENRQVNIESIRQSNQCSSASASRIDTLPSSDHK